MPFSTSYKIQNPDFTANLAISIASSAGNPHPGGQGARICIYLQPFIDFAFLNFSYISRGSLIDVVAT